MNGLMILAFAALLILVLVLYLRVLHLKEQLKAGGAMPVAQDEEEDTESVNYRWELDSPHHIRVKGNLTLRFSPSYIECLRRRNPYATQAGGGNVENIRDMVRCMHMHPQMMRNMLRIVQYISRQCSKHSLYEYDRLQFVLDFVQMPNISYIHDDECEEINHQPQYIRFPDETLYDKRGDCDCKSMLAAMLFHIMGYKVLMLLSRSHQHAAIGLEYSDNWKRMMPDKQRLDDVLTVYRGKKYVFCETTSDGFRIGGISRHQSMDDFTEIVEITGL